MWRAGEQVPRAVRLDILRDRSFGTWGSAANAAIVVFAVAFGVYHWVQWGLWNQPVAMLFTLLSTGTGHVLFAVAFLRGRSLWPAIGLHLGWNVADQALRVHGAQGTAAYLTGFAVSELLVAAVVVAMLRGLPRSPAARVGGRGAP